MRVFKLSVSIQVLVCTLPVAEVVVVVWYIRRRREFLRQRFFQQIDHARMKDLRSRIPPHLTFNVLGHKVSQFNGSKEVKCNLTELMKYLHRSLELTEKLSVSLQGGLDFVRTYIELERGHVGEDLVATITVEDGLDAIRIMIPSTTVQIPVESAIKHGLAGKDGKKKLIVHVSRETNGIRIMVTNNGCGYLPRVASATRGTNTELKVLYQTTQLLNTKNKSDEVCFNIANRSNGQTSTEVSVYIPFRFSYDL